MARSSPPIDAAGELAGLIGDAVALLDGAGLQRIRSVSPIRPGPSLLEQCLQLCRQAGHRDAEPIRTIHHFACTGGTLISKCIAALPNVQLLSEVDPLSTLPHGPKKSKFVPTDMIGLMRRSSRGADERLLLNIFCNSLRLIYEDCAARGLRLVLRDHAHSQFCTGAEIPDRPSLRQALPFGTAVKSAVKSLVTVRHPLDSYLSLVANGWRHFQPQSLDEYAKRYLAFLEHYRDAPLVRYEEFIINPTLSMGHICQHLDIPMNPDFVDLFSLVELSGDSGRRSHFIGTRERRKLDESIVAETGASSHYLRLCDVLSYPLT